MMNYLKIILIIFVTSSCSNSNSITRFDDKTDKEVLIEQVLYKALVEKDIPDYSLLKDKKNIVISLETMNWFGANSVEEIIRDTLDVSELPKLKRINLIPLLPHEIENRANKNGDFLYLQFNFIDIKGETAKVAIETTWAASDDSEVMYLSGGGYCLQFIKNNDSWIFDRMLFSWIS